MKSPGDGLPPYELDAGARAHAAAPARGTTTSRFEVLEERRVADVMSPLDGRLRRRHRRLRAARSGLVRGAPRRRGAGWLGLDLARRAAVAGVHDARSASAGGRLRRIDADVTDRDALERRARARRRRDVGAPTCSSTTPASTSRRTRRATYRIEDCRSRLFRGMLDVNLAGTFQVTQVFGAPWLRRRRAARSSTSARSTPRSRPTRVLRSPARRPAVPEAAGLRGLEGGRAEPDALSSHPLGPARASG